MLLALATIGCVGLVFSLSEGTKLLMPGSLKSGHAAIKNCSACHTKSGSGKLSWMRGLIQGDPHADSKACLTCHKMPETAFNAHGASTEVLKQSTERLAKIAAKTPVPQAAHAQSIAFPTDRLVARDLYCATCHQEHQGANFNLSKISNEQCRSCHVVKFDSFDGNHPQFESYPFKRRTRIIYDHAGHFRKHYPEVVKKDPAKRVPEGCSTCHDSREDRRVMAVAPFEKTCSGCHLDQIVGKERASGPKGIAFLTLPGIDVQGLKEKNASIGEWPDASEAALTPFMKLMIGRTERGRALIESVAGLNLQDLSTASDKQIEAVTGLVWEIKGLYFALISGTASDALRDINIGDGAKLSASLVADLTANIPRDVVASAQRDWLPNLAAEMADRKVTAAQDQGSWSTTTTKSGSATSDAPQTSKPGGDKRDSSKAMRNFKPLISPMKAGIIVADNLVHSAQAGETDAASEDNGGPIKRRWQLPSGTPRAIDALTKDVEKAEQLDETNAKSDSSRTGKPAEKAVAPEGGADSTKPTATKLETSPPNAPAQGKATKQTDDLLFPTEEELRGLKAISDDGATSSRARRAVNEAADTAAAKPDDAASSRDQAAPFNAGAPLQRTAPVISIENDVDPESWAEHGGWYRQDYAIYYRPTGHKDKFIYSWLSLTGPQAGDGSAAAAVFDYLAGKDAQGSCTKCHSVDNLQNKGRAVNFSPVSAESKMGRFTNFIHEPHFGVMANRGCLACHELKKEPTYLKGYEQGKPQSFSSNFGNVKKDLCQDCHSSNLVRQDCLTCHKYHVNDLIAPVMSTKLPDQ